MNNEQWMVYKAEAIADKAALDSLRVNGFDPLAAARDYPRIEEDRRRLVEALRDTHRILADLPAASNYGERIKANRALLAELGEAA